MVLKKFFKGFPDNRGYLNPIDIESLLNEISKPDFNFKYQLLSSSVEKNIFRGFHYQAEPFEQTKILIIHQGSIKDIIFPINGPSRASLMEFDLEVGDVIVIPSNYAHGFYTKTPNVLLQYLIDEKFSPNHYTGFSPLEYIKTASFSSMPLISSQDLNLPKLIL
jgi:dTDP-4-dehydrorhamnose 3,5-epimerase